MATRTYYKQGKSKTAAIVLAVVAFVMTVGTLCLCFTNQFFAGWLAAPIILLSVAAFVLTMCAITVSPELLTISVVFTMLSQLASLFVVLSRAVDCVIFNDLQKWTQIVIPISVGAVFTALYVGFVIVTAKSVKCKSTAKGFKALFACMVVAVALVLGLEVFSAVFGHYEVNSAEDYYSTRISAYNVAIKEIENSDLSNYEWFATYEDDFEHVIVYEVIGSTSRSNAQDTDSDRRAALSAMQGIGSVSLEDCYVSDSFDERELGSLPTLPRYVLIDYENWGGDRSYALYSLKGDYTETILTARQAFEAETGAVLARTNKYKVIPNSYDYFGFAESFGATKYNVEYLRIAEVSVKTRVPDVFFAVTALCSLITVYLLVVRCETETVEVSYSVKGAYASNGFDGKPELLKQSIAYNVFLTIVTLGIYGFVWFYRVAKNVRKICEQPCDGVGDEVASLIFGGGIYAVYWYHSRVSQLQQARENGNINAPLFSAGTYLALSLLTVGILPLCLITNQLNGVIDELNGKSEQLSEPNADNLALMSNRLSIVKYVLLGIVTLGVYFIVMSARIVNRINILKGRSVASTKQLVCLFLVPFYWIYWLATYSDKLDEQGNRATLEAWLISIIPFYAAYYLVTNGAVLENASQKYGFEHRSSPVLTVVSAFAPVIGLCIALTVLDRISARIDTLITEE